MEVAKRKDVGLGDVLKWVSKFGDDLGFGWTVGWRLKVGYNRPE